MDDNDRFEKPMVDDPESDHLFRGTVWSLIALIAVLLGVAGYWAVSNDQGESLAERPAVTQPYVAPPEAAPPAIAPGPTENQPSSDQSMPGDTDSGSPPVEPAERGNTRL